MYSKLPFSSTEEKTLREIYAESQELIYHFNRIEEVKNQVLRLRRARERTYDRILEVINANVQRPGKVYYIVTRDGKKIKTKGKIPVLDSKNSFICYDEESFVEAEAGLLDAELLRLARWQVKKQGLPAIFYLDKSKLTFPLLDGKTYDKCRKLCRKLDEINDHIKKFESESCRTNSDLGKCKDLLSKIDEKQRRTDQEHQLLEWLYEEAEETSHVLQKRHEERKARLQPKIRDLRREGIAFEVFKKWCADDPYIIKALSLSRPKIMVYLEDAEISQLIESAISMEYLTKAIKTLSIKKGELKKGLEVMKNLASQLDDIKSKLI